jgi:hypothetical protein
VRAALRDGGAALKAEKHDETDDLYDDASGGCRRAVARCACAAQPGARS